jgi:hypothetical protein
MMNHSYLYEHRVCSFMAKCNSGAKPEKMPDYSLLVGSANLRACVGAHPRKKNRHEIPQLGVTR